MNRDYADAMKSDLPDEALVVESEFERDLAKFASRLALYKNGGASDAMFESALHDTGLRLVKIVEKQQIGTSFPIVGAVASGILSIDYFLPRRRPGIPQKPVLSKVISEGSSFYVSRDTEAVFTVTPNTWLVVRDGVYTGVETQIEIEGSIKLGADLSSLSDADLIGRVGEIDFANVSELVAAAHPVLAEIAARRALLREFISTVRTDPKLRGDAELLAEFYKYVLHRAPSDARLRLHLFRPDAAVHPHAHRWAMVSYVLSGQIMPKYHCLEGDASLATNDAGAVNISHRLQAGSCYAFSDPLIHSFRGAPGSATLTLRGPAEKQKAAEFRAAGFMQKVSVEVGAEPSLTMTPEQFEYGIDHLKMINVL
jgi:hypothetical protein